MQDTVYQVAVITVANVLQDTLALAVNVSKLISLSFLGPFKCCILQWGWECQILKKITNLYGSTLLVLRGVGWMSNFHEKSVS